MASKQRAGFTAHVYENDYEEIQKLVQQYPIIETGGDLFGLWQDKNTVVIQLFIGPGKDCRRTTTSFHQDIDYLAKVGGVITKEEGLCNVGEWHSHHQIGMPNPSKNDNETVLSNMPQLGLDRFVLFIASIESSSAKKQKRPRDVKLENIKIRCFMYKEGLHVSRQPIEGKIIRIPGINPLQQQNKARNIITNVAGAAPKQEEEAQDKKPKSRDKEESVNNESQRGRYVGDENTSPNRGVAQTTHEAPNHPPAKTQSTPRPGNATRRNGNDVFGSQSTQHPGNATRMNGNEVFGSQSTPHSGNATRMNGNEVFGSQSTPRSGSATRRNGNEVLESQSTPGAVYTTRMNAKGFF